MNLNNNKIYFFLIFILFNFLYALKRNPKFSIIIPIYNIQEKIFENCLNSILNQTFEDFEIILINNKSTDITPQLLDYYTAKYDKIVTIHKIINESNGLVKNNGLDFVNGNFLMFLNDDDFISPSLLQIAYKEIKNGDFDVTEVEHLNFKENQKNSNEIKELKSVNIIKNYSTFIIDENNWNVVNNINQVSYNKIYKSSFIFKHKFKFTNNTNFDEDSIFLYTYFPYLNKIKKIQTKLIINNHKKFEISKNKQENFYLRYRIILNNMELIFKKWKKDRILKLPRGKKILTVFFYFIRTYCKEPFYQNNFIIFLSKHRKVFKKKIFLSDKIYRNLFRKLLFRVKKETDINFYNIVNNKDYCEY